MGKKSKMKKINRIAKALPELMGDHVVGKQVSGSELLERGVDKLSNGAAVDSRITYREKVVERVAISHKRQMKQLFYKHGESAAVEYAEQVQRLHAAHLRKQAQQSEQTETIQSESI